MIDKIRSLFQPQDQKKNEQSIKDAEDQLRGLGELARKCLEAQDFKIYRVSYERTEASIVDALISYTKHFVENPGGDVTKYALTNVRLLTKLENLRFLLNSVQSDVRQDIMKDKEAVQVKK